MPILHQVGPNKPNMTSQIVESYISDMLVFLLDLLGTTKAAEFGKKHLGTVEVVKTIELDKQTI